jgi:copper chaperone CopZ
VILVVSSRIMKRKILSENQQANVSLETKEAKVKYDPDVVKVEDLIKAYGTLMGCIPSTLKLRRRCSPAGVGIAGASCRYVSGTS